MNSLFSFLDSGRQSLVGIDISSSAVRLLELAQKNGQYRVEAYAAVALPEHAVEGKNIKDVEAVTQAVIDVVAQSKTKAKQAAIAVPDSSVITKIVQLEDGLTEEESEELVVLEADKYIPYAIEDVSIDYNILGPSAKNENLNDVLVVASRAENVNARAAVIPPSGLELVIVDVESYAIERACQLFVDDLPDGGVDKTVAIIDIGDRFTQLTVVHNLVTVFSREESFGGRQLTDELIRRYDLSYEEANEAKKKGTLPDDYISEVLTPYKETVAIQVKRALQFFFSTSQYSEIDAVLLAGGTAQIPGLVQEIAEHTDLPVVLADPMLKMAVANHIDVQMLSRDASALMIACGLALRKFEL